MSEWINVKDKLPEIGVQVLVFPEDDFMFYDVGERREVDGQWETMGDLSKYRPINWWMEIPKAPSDNRG